MLFTQATTIILAVTLAHGSSEFDGTVKQFNSMQASLRRLQDVPEIPAACLAACPSAAAMMTRLSAAMLPHMGKAAALGAGSAGESSENMTPDQLTAQMAEIMPLFKSLQMVNNDDMCANQADYKCLFTNADKCKSASEGGMEMLDPIASAAKNGPLMECMCNKCQGAAKAQVDMAATMMSVMMAGFAQLASAMAGGSSGATETEASKAQAKALEKDLLKGICPLIGMTRCFDAYPTQCKDMLSKQTLSNMNASAMGPKCTLAGIKALVAPVVSTAFTIKGLDFDKVVGDAVMKAEVINKVKEAFIKVIPGYIMSDIVVKLTKGSVVATVEVTPLPGASTESLLSIVKADPAAMATSVITAVQGMDKLATVLEAGKTKDTISATASAPSSPSSSSSSSSGTTESSTPGTTASGTQVSSAVVCKILVAIPAVGMILASM